MAIPKPSRPAPDVLSLLEKEIEILEAKLKKYSLEEEASPRAFGQRLYLAGLKHARELMLYSHLF